MFGKRLEVMSEDHKAGVDLSGSRDIEVRPGCCRNAEVCRNYTVYVHNEVNQLLDSGEQLEYNIDGSEET